MKTFWLIGLFLLLNGLLQSSQLYYAIPQNQDIAQENPVQNELKVFDFSCDVSSMEIEEKENLEAEGIHFIVRKKPFYLWNKIHLYCPAIRVSAYSIWLSETGDLSPPVIK